MDDFNDHVITIIYTSDDDGIHLNCACGWSVHLGFNITVEYAVRISNEHHNANQKEKKNEEKDSF